MSLAPCRSCSRHIRTADRECPFCGGPASVEVVPVRSLAGLSRAMLFFGGSVALATAIEACGGEPLPAPVSVPGAATGAAEVDAAVATPPSAPSTATASSTPTPVTRASSDAGAPASGSLSQAPPNLDSAAAMSGQVNASNIPLAGASGYGGPPLHDSRLGGPGTQPQPPKTPPKK